jgi:hypothetical protein
MNKFLKILLLVVAAVVAVKLLPLTLALGFLLGLLLVGLLVLGLSLVGVVFVAAIALGAISAPLWIPLLVVVGLIALIKKLSAKPAASAAG